MDFCIVSCYHKDVSGILVDNRWWFNCFRHLYLWCVILVRSPTCVVVPMVYKRDNATAEAPVISAPAVASLAQSCSQESLSSGFKFRRSGDDIFVTT